MLSASLGPFFLCSSLYGAVSIACAFCSCPILIAPLIMCCHHCYGHVVSLAISISVPVILLWWLSSLSVIVLWLSSSSSSPLVFHPLVPSLSVSVSPCPIVFVVVAPLLFCCCALPIFTMPVACFHHMSRCL